MTPSHQPPQSPTPTPTPTPESVASRSRRSVIAVGTGAALTAAAGLRPWRANAATPASHRRSHGLASRVPVADGVEVYVQDLNGGDRGTILFVPGWPLSSGTFEQQYSFLADRGYRALGIDLRGFGRSDAPYGPYDYDVWASDILTVLTALKARDVTIVGHSMGGAVALRHVAHFGSRIGRLVLVEASAPRYVTGPKSEALAAGLAGLIDGYETNRAATVHDLAASFFATHTDVDNDPYLHYFERQCLDEASLQASRAGLVALRDTDLTADMGLVRVPTRVFQATRDDIVPFDHGQTLASNIRGAELVTFTHGGHGIYIDEPDKFNAELLAFLP